LVCHSTLPSPLGKTSQSLPSFLGHLSFHSRSVFTTIGGRGTVRTPAVVFGGPIWLKRSALWRTCRLPLVRSTSSQRRPRSSLARRPVKIAVSSNGRHLPSTAAMMRLISSGVGMSIPTFNLPPRSCLAPLPRRRRWLRNSRTGLRMISPRSCASASKAPRLRTTYLTMVGERSFSRSLSSKLRIVGALSCDSFVRPMIGSMCSRRC
jgi:hypothetical protein